jgi:hypothetical protein
MAIPCRGSADAAWLARVAAKRTKDKITCDVVLVRRPDNLEKCTAACPFLSAFCATPFHSDSAAL